VSDEAGKAMQQEIRHWRLQRRSDKTLGDLARMFNGIVQGWINLLRTSIRSTAASKARARRYQLEIAEPLELATQLVRRRYRTDLRVIIVWL
jgi:hypothetical protein